MKRTWAWWWALGACLLAPLPAGAQAIGGNASLSVTSSSARVAFPSTSTAYRSAIIAPALGTSVEVFYALGESSVTAIATPGATQSPALPPGGICLALGAATNLAAITATGSATLRITQVNSCAVPFQGGGNGSSGGGGGSVTQGTVPWLVDPSTRVNWGLGQTGSAIPSIAALLGLSNSGTLNAWPGDSTSGAWVNIKSSVSLPVTGTFWPYSLGQAAMAASVPVAIANNQSAIPVSQSGAWTGVGVTGTFWPYALGQATMSSSVPVTIASNQSSVPVTATQQTVQSGVATNLISCDSHVFKHITSATDTLAVQGVTAKTIYVCGALGQAAGTATWFLENTASVNANCSSSNTQIMGVGTMAANGSTGFYGASWGGLKNTAGNGLCINSTGTGGVDVDIWYTQF